MTSKSYAHPMLEPINYDIDPNQASSILAGDSLEVYSLLWYSAVASQINGPLIMHNRLYKQVSDKYFLSANWYGVVEAGWGEILPNELQRTMQSSYKFHGQSYSDQVSQYSEIEDMDPVCMQVCNYNTNISISSNAAICAQVYSEEKLTYARLIDEMVKYNVGRPSTYASRIESAIKNKLLTESNNNELCLTPRATDILLAISRQAEEQQINKHLTSSIEESIEKIIDNHCLAADELDRYAEQLFGKKPVISKWLKNLDVNEFCSAYTDKSISEDNGANSSKDNMQVREIINDNSLTKILIEKNTKSAVSFYENAWDDYTFETMLSSTKVIGRLYTRKADRLYVSNEVIFSEHLNDFNIIVTYCLLPNVPYLHYVNRIEFTLQTDRTKGNLYLENLKVQYFTYSDYNEWIIDEQDRFIEVMNRAFDDVDYLDANYLMSCWDNDQGVQVEYMNISVNDVSE